jgi:acetyltransferase-like isoleucine patch superfamily enzyme
MVATIIKAIKRKIRFFLVRKRFPKSTTICIHETFLTGEYMRISVSKTAKIEILENVTFRAFGNIVVEQAGTLLIGKNVFFNNYCSLNCLDEITIGENTLIGESVKIYDHNHKYSNAPQFYVHPDQFSTAPVHIGQNCWIGSNVVILKGVTIGNNVIIGANNLIYKSVPSNTVVKLKSEVISQSTEL